MRTRLVELLCDVLANVLAELVIRGIEGLDQLPWLVPEPML
jgi:hypothetical protein